MYRGSAYIVVLGQHSVNGVAQDCYICGRFGQPLMKTKRHMAANTAQTSLFLLREFSKSINRTLFGHSFFNVLNMLSLILVVQYLVECYTGSFWYMYEDNCFGINVHIHVSPEYVLVCVNYLFKTAVLTVPSVSIDNVASAYLSIVER